MQQVVLVLVGLILSGGMALADGGFFPVYEGVANTADQRAIVVDHGGSQTIVLQTAYEGDASDFAWVIPVPSFIPAREMVGTADPAVFDVLDGMTAPRAVTWHESAFLCGCSGAGDGSDEARAGVTVWDTLRIEDYDVAVLSSDDSGDLATWLQDNGYGFPDGHEETLQYYVDQASFFVAFKIAPHDTNGDPAPPGTPGDGVPVPQDLRPITVTFATEEIVFPIRISQVSTLRRAEVLLYVISGQRMRGANYTTAEVVTNRTWRGDSFARAYDRWFEDTIAIAGGKTLVVEYAGYLPRYEADEGVLRDILHGRDRYFLTRMRTRLLPQQMQEDMRFVADGDQPFRVDVQDGVAEVRGTVAGGLMLFAGMQALAFRSRRGRRAAWATAMFALVVAIL